MIEYRIITIERADSLSHAARMLEYEVEKLIADDWEPFGSPTFARDSTPLGEFTAVQPMLRTGGPRRWAGERMLGRPTEGGTA
jgi:hypothetical protein